METMTNVEDWKKNNINGQVAVKLKEIWKKKWEKVYMVNNFEHSLKYQGREMKLWLKVVGSKVGDIPDESDYVYTAYLWDFAVCHDFYEAVGELQKEKGFNLEISDNISFKDCVSALWWEYGIIKKAMETIGESELKNKEIRDEIFRRICNDLNWILSQYSVIIKYWRFYLGTKNPILKQNIINKDKTFLDDMNKIKEYFNNNIAEIQSKINNAINEEKRKDEETKREQEKKAEDLQNQL